MSIEIKNLSKTYGLQKALDNISFRTQSNHIIGFLGPNGAGKSTTMKILAGILSFDSGDVLVNGKDVKKEAIAVKARLGYLQENNPLYLDMYVREVLAFEADLHGLKNREQRIDEVIEMTGLTLEQNKKVSALSKGYKQRVGLASAIIHDPDILILDEPTTGLDPNQIIEIRNLIQRLAINKTVLFSTHIMQEVEAICDEIIIINQGKIKDHFLKIEQTERYGDLRIEDIFVQLTKN